MNGSWRGPKKTNHNYYPPTTPYSMHANTSLSHQWPFFFFLSFFLCALDFFFFFFLDLMAGHDKPQIEHHTTMNKPHNWYNLLAAQWSGAPMSYLKGTATSTPNHHSNNAAEGLSWTALAVSRGLQDNGGWVAWMHQIGPPWSYHPTSHYSH